MIGHFFAAAGFAAVFYLAGQLIRHDYLMGWIAGVTAVFVFKAIFP